MAEGPVGDNISMLSGQWSFDGIEKEFDVHAMKSIPFYQESHAMTVRLAEYFITSGSSVLDIGCSTGTLLKTLYQGVDGKLLNLKLFGVDPVASMAHQTEENLRSAGIVNFEIHHGSFLDFYYEDIDLITSLYTFQFLHPSIRHKAIKQAYDALKIGGALICFEKVKADQAIFNELFLEQYSDFKSRNGYTEEEKAQKTRSLRGVMRPFTEAQNIQMLKLGGFSEVSRVFKWLCFEGYLAIK